MISDSARYIEWLLDYRYPLLFLIAVVEGPLVTLLAGFLVSLAKFDFAGAFAVIVLGDMGGDILYYALGRFGGRKGIQKWGHRIGMTTDHLARLESHFKRHPGKTLVVGKLAHGFGGPFLLAAGIANMPFGNFLFLDLLPTLPKSLLLLSLGFYFGSAYLQVNHFLNSASLVFLVLGLACLLLYFVTPRMARLLIHEKV